MAEAKRKKAGGDEVRFISLSNGDRGALLEVLRGRQVEGKDQQRGLYRAITALIFDEEVVDEIDQRNEAMAELNDEIQDSAGEDRAAARAERKELAEKNKAWRKEETTLALTVETIVKITEQIHAAKITGFGVEKLIPVLDLLEEAKDDKEGGYSKPPDGFYSSLEDAGENVSLLVDETKSSVK